MNKQQKIIVSIVGITIVLLALLGITYAYYLTRIQGNTNTNSISVTTADLKLEYGDGNGLLTATNIMPGKQVEFKTTGNETTTKKTFTVTNSGNSTIEGYAVSLDYAYIAEVMPSIFERPEDFIITLTCLTNKTGESCNGFTGNFNNESIMLTSNSIDEGEVHTYSLSIYYNDPGIDQSNDMGKNLNLKVQIYNINETTDIEGTITGVDSTHSVRIESEPKMSTIVNGKYNFKGVEIGTHTLTVLDKDGNEVDKEYIVVKSGTTPSITTTKATVNNTEVDATGITITKEERVAKLSTKVESNVLSFDTSTSSTTVFNPYSSNKNSLAYQIINNAIVAKNNGSTTETIYSLDTLTNLGNVTGENERILSTTIDDYGTSYYFRGKVNDNYVNFNDMCWRIVRVQGDGSIKLILADIGAVCSAETLIKTNSSLIGTKVNSYKTPSQFVDGGNWSLDINSLVVTFNPLDKKYLKEERWCTGNVEIAFDSSKKDVGLASDYDICTNWGYYYNSLRIYDDNNYTMKCSNTAYNGSYSYDYTYGGGLTADEIIFAGGILTNGNNDFYLKDNATEEYISGMNANGWASYTITGFGDCDNDEGRFLVDFDGGHANVYGSHTFSDIRPAVVLKYNIKYVSGDGTVINPYIIQ